MKPLFSQRGFSLIELLVAMAIGMVFMAAVVRVYVSTGDAYRKMEGVAAVQNDGRFIINFLQNIIMSAGYRGCAASGSVLNNRLNGSATYAYDFSVPLDGNESTGVGTWSPALDPALASALSGSDVITVRGVNDYPVSVTAQMASLTSDLTVNALNNFSSGTILMVSDCAGNVDVFQKTNSFSAAAATSISHAAGGAGPGNSSGTLATTYGTSAAVAPVSTTGIFVAVSPTTGINSLYVIQPSSFGTTATQLVEGVDGMQILYGVATVAGSNTATQYMPADAVTAAGAWDNVMTVRVAVLVSSPNASTRTPDTRIYNVLGVNYGPFGDFRERRVFTTTVTLRNRYLRQ
ncbi:MAG TPA: PilW family protein [Mariprofundaceae bacterium]|nr:PilW family protein [Mariprofundaceae bacterium]